MSVFHTPYRVSASKRQAAVELPSANLTSHILLANSLTDSSNFLLIKPAPKLRTTSVNVNLHCDKCEKDLRQKLLKHKDIYSVKTNMKAQTLTVDGTVKSDKLLNYMRNKVHKNAEIITSKFEKKEEKKSEVKEVEKKGEEKKSEKKEVEKKEKSTETVQVVEFKTEKKVEVKTKEGNAPYFIHYVYAPQLFSDENPNACFIM